MIEKPHRARQRESGFTLIELLIVILILGILAGIAILAVGPFESRAQEARDEICAAIGELDGAARRAGIEADLVSEEFADCTTTTTTTLPTPAGAIIVKKQTIPGDDPTEFTFTGDAAGDISDGERIVVADLTPGTYSVTELVPAPWDLTDVSCDATDWTWDGTPTAAFAVADGQTVTCTFTNTKPVGTIIVEKQTLPDGDPTMFTFGGDAAGRISDDRQIVVSGLDPGTFTATELVPAGWDLTGITCDDGNSTGDVGTGVATFNLELGETVTCTFTNTELGTIIVEKQTNPDGDLTLFTFEGDAAGQIADDGQIVVDNLIPGEYSVKEIAPLPEDWAIADIACDDTNSTGDVEEGEATFNVEPGETVTCTFNNTKFGTIIVEKQTVPNADPTPFRFTGVATGSIADGGQIEVVNLDPGAYTATEIVPEGWYLTGISCDDTNSIGNLGTNSADFNVEVGETVTCTFNNSKFGTIIVEKQTLPDGDPTEFTYTGDALPIDEVDRTITDGGQILVGDLIPGAYSVTELVPADWVIADISCDDTNSTGDPDTGVATFRVGVGETVKCTFTNAKSGTIIVEKQTLPDGDPTEFIFTGEVLPIDEVDRTITDGEQIVVDNLVPGTYSVAETTLLGWDLTGIACDDGNSTWDLVTNTATFMVEADETVTCAFTNLAS
ncbi:MAG: prepilin-type N-terminal cleavage/methylation domain-containing protein [Acidobacteria bacterium]|nr:prepilin-type N-terminal cleavage/methylation domain-containing protein [Acidobacteriota bacterium]